MSAAGIGQIRSCAGIGLPAGGMIGNWFGKRATFKSCRRAVVVCYIVRGGAYMVFSRMRRYWLALLFIGLSRAAVAVSSVLNMTQLLCHVADAFRGRIPA